MKINPLLIALLTSVSISASGDAIDHKPEKLEGTYLLYSGSLEEMELPNSREAKIRMQITGTLAKQIFQHMGRAAAIKGECVNGMETRVAGNLACSLTPKGDRVYCDIGIDTKNGQAINGTIC